MSNTATTAMITTTVDRLKPGDRIVRPVGVCTVAGELTPAKRGGVQVGYRVRLDGPDGSRLATWVAPYGAVVEVERTEADEWRVVPNRRERRRQGRERACRHGAGLGVRWKRRHRSH